jgi:hypothetical protein
MASLPSQTQCSTILFVQNSWPVTAPIPMKRITLLMTKRGVDVSSRNWLRVSPFDVAQDASLGELRFHRKCHRDKKVAGEKIGV